ncbi:MAG: hydrogenase maturation protease [Desulfocapsaceae bacterium]|nr:hydrogenase maturation protease [Desulfocapsaceae bacterium]
MNDTALVVCIGNDLVADDGVGHAVYAELNKRVLPQGTRLKLLGLGGMALINEFSGETTLIVVDAVQFGVTAGTVHVLSWDDLPGSESHVSCHGIGIREAIEVSRKLYPQQSPESVFLVGVEGQCFDQLGEGLTAEVAASIPLAVEKVVDLVTKKN